MAKNSHMQVIGSCNPTLLSRIPWPVNGDRIGVIASVLCAIHCAATPLIFLFLPLFGDVWAHPASHWIMASFVIPLAVVAVRSGFTKHRRKWVIASGGLGITLILAGAAAPSFQQASPSGTPAPSDPAPSGITASLVPGSNSDAEISQTDQNSPSEVAALLAILDSTETTPCCASCEDSVEPNPPVTKEKPCCPSCEESPGAKTTACATPAVSKQAPNAKEEPCCSSCEESSRGKATACTAPVLSKQVPIATVKEKPCCPSCEDETTTESVAAPSVSDDSDLACCPSCEDRAEAFVSSSTGSSETTTAGCVDACCPSLQEDANGKMRLHIPLASVLTTMGGLFLIATHIGNLCGCASCPSAKSIV